MMPNTEKDLIIRNNDAKKIRTIRDVMREIKKIDAETALTENALRVLIKNGEIHSVKVGKKHLLTVEDVWEYFYK